MRSRLLLFILVGACLFGAMPGSGQSSAQDPDVPVLKRRPPADDTGQQTGPTPESTQPQPTPPPAQSSPDMNAPPARTSGQPSGNGNAAPDHHHADVMRHGAEAMGFDQETTTHHFVLTHSGGVIRITTVDPNDATGAGQISIHLRDAAARFAQGDFSQPQHTHGEMPPGVQVMQQLRRKIIYTAHSIAGGAELIITSEDQRAVHAIHDFLQFQIRDHQTGDSVAVR